MSYFNNTQQNSEILESLKNKDNLGFNVKGQYGKRINELVIDKLDEHNVHLVKGQEFVIEQRIVRITSIWGLNYNVFADYVALKIVEDILLNCNDRVVMFWDFFYDINYYENHYTASFNDADRHSLLINCGYRFVDKSHTSITPPKNMVKMYMNYEKNKF